MNEEQNIELAACEADIRAHFLADMPARYVPGLPIAIQIARSLRRLEQCYRGQHSASNGESAQNDVQQEDLNGKTAGGALVAVNGIGKLGNEGNGQRAFDLLMNLRTNLSMFAQGLDQLARLHGDVTAFGSVGHSVQQGRNTGAAAQARGGLTPTTEPATC